MQTAKRISGDAIFTFAVVIVAVVIIGLVAFMPKEAKSTREIVDSCTTDMATQFHIHPNVKIIINGETVEIPTNIGVTEGCMKPIHTHDVTGKIHVESPVKRDFTLGDFFYVWNKPFNSNEVMDRSSDADHSVTLTVNGVPSNEFENLILEDLQEIVITYGK